MKSPQHKETLYFNLLKYSWDSFHWLEFFPIIIIDFIGLIDFGNKEKHFYYQRILTKMYALEKTLISLFSSIICSEGTNIKSSKRSINL